MQRLDLRDEPPHVGEYVELDNLTGLEPLEQLFGEVDDEYIDLMCKYNPTNVTGKIVLVTDKELSVRVKWNTGIYNSYYPHNLREV